MVVVIGIIIIMTGVILANLPQFRSKISLDLVAQEVAITVRQAQVYGIATKTGLSTSDDLFPSFGVYFDLAENPSNSFILFADSSNKNGRYDALAGCFSGPSNTECREQFLFHNGIKILNVEMCPASGSCVVPAGLALSATFIRPNFDAKFYDGDGGEIIDKDYAKITIGKDANDVRYINVWSTGHIYVSTPTTI